MHLRVQTGGGGGGVGGSTPTADDALVKACEELGEVVDWVKGVVKGKTRFGREEAVEMRRGVGEGEEEEEEA